MSVVQREVLPEGRFSSRSSLPLSKRHGLKPYYVPGTKYVLVDEKDFCACGANRLAGEERNEASQHLP